MFGNWQDGSFRYKNKLYLYCMKRFDLPSKFGIDQGRISKLSMTRGNEEVLHYDRGWDIKPVDDDAKQALALLLEKHN